MEDVASVSNFYLNEIFTAPNVAPNGPPFNETSRDIIGATVANSRGYDGSTQTVAVADTGIGGGTTTTAHRDIPSSRVTAIYNWPGAAGSCFQTVVNDGSIDVDSGHGTHTSGSVLSGGEGSGLGRGTAPAAHLVFQSTENYATITSICRALYGYTNGYYLLGLPSNLQNLYSQAYTAGARIHSNSWGAAVAGDYNTDGVNTDTFVWNNRDMVITFSAGNEGIDANANGVIDNDSIGAPATAKNLITVGASENQRSDNYLCDTGLSYTACAAQGGVNSIFTWGSAWPADYPANPIKDDVSANNAQQMAAFSSRGPTGDGRMKPDLVAPGERIQSSLPGGEWGELDGTSMAAPHVSGAAAMLMARYAELIGQPRQIKRVLCESATDLGRERSFQGHGMLDVLRAFQKI